MTLRTGVATVVATMLGVSAAAAADADTLRLYAVLAKLEANKAEAAGALLLAAMPDHSDEIYEEAVEDWESDGAQIRGYLELLERIEMTDAQRASVNAFAEGWAAAVAAGTPLLEGYEDTPEYRQRVFVWWESLDGLDDLVDDLMEDILEEHGLSLEN